MKATLLGLITTSWLAACSGDVNESAQSGGTTGSSGSSSATSSTGTGGSTVLPACTWPASFDGVDAGSDAGDDGQCTAARAFLSCSSLSGTTELCLSDDATACPNAQAGYTCHDECHADEFGAACGHNGPGTQPPAPTGCRSVGGTPDGVVYYCCPCDS